MDGSGPMLTTRPLGRAVQLSLCFGVCLLGLASNAQPASPPTAEALLGEVIAAYRTGDLQGAWDAFASFFDHPSRNELHYDAFMDCFFNQQCPQVGAIGRILGFPRAELVARIKGFCPNLHSETEDHLREAGVAENDIAEYRKIYPRIVENGLNGTCASWRQEQLDLMFADPRPVDIHAQALPLAWYGHQDGGLGVAIETFIGSVSLRMVVDTGSSLGSLYRRSKQFPDLEVEISDRRRSSKGIFEYLTSRPARVASLRVGRTLHQPFGLDVSDDERLYDHGPIPQNGLLGMAFLLRYPAVCFAWDEQRLHLGPLGPCAGGKEPYDAHLRGSLMLGFAVDAHDGTRFTASVDTGAWHTNCSAVFSKANAGRSSFSFGNHPSLAAECLFDEAVLYRPAKNGFPQIDIRMNDLHRFSAFGWRLNPLRVYFVPRADVASPTDLSVRE